MDPAARAAILSIPEEDLKVAKAEEVELYLRALELHGQLLSPLDYAVTVSKAQRYDHIELLNRWIMAQIEGRLYFDGPGPHPVLREGVFVHPTRGDRVVFNLAISMPPRQGKSYLVSEHLPAWFLTNYPAYSCLLASYEADFAQEWSGKVRDHIADHPEFGIDVAGGKNAARKKFDLDGHRGFMKAAGAGGPLTGSGGHLIIVDDPIKNAQDAMSAIERENLDNWWRSTLYTRREPWGDGSPGRIILMSTRWHEDDLHGRRIPKPPTAGSKWAQLNLMGIFEATDDEPVDPIGRSEGDPLCAERMSLSDLTDTRQEMGEPWFQAMYQGHPSLEEGNIIKRPFNYYTLRDGNYVTLDEHGAKSYVSEEECYRFGTLDMAGTTKSYSDFTVLMVVDVSREDPRRMFVRAIERVKMETESHEVVVEGWYHKWGLKALHIEDKTFGTNLIGRLIGKAGLVISKLSADRDKITRALPVHYEIRNLMVWFPESADWKTVFETEVTKFPNATHDDMVDVLAYAVQIFKTLPMFIHKPREPETPMEKAIAHRDELARKNLRGKRRNIPGLGRW